jgi:acyl transferase domain-containing protein
LDNQVKIRGFRIELGEIEAALKHHANILDAIVITHGSAADNKRLVAFVVNREGKETSRDELTAHLKKILPTYMLPTDIVTIATFPLLSSGKIDRQALADSLLKQTRSKEKTDPVHVKGTKKIAFMFSGQGLLPVISQELLTKPVFKENIDYCAKILKPYLQLDIRDILTSKYTQEQIPTRIAQPALFVFEYALAQLMIERGITPTILIGHSVGEWVAAAISGVFSLDDSLELITRRGEFMDKQAPGKMLAVSLPEKEALKYLQSGLSLATVNTPEQTVISGPEEKIDELSEKLESLNIQATKLNTSHAFHSEMMTPAMAEMEKAVAAVERSAPTIPFISNLTGKPITDEQATSPRYWARHLRETVRFSDGLNTLLADRDLALLEIGPGRILINMVLRSPAYAQHPALACIDPSSGKPDLINLDATAAALMKNITIP